MSEKTRIPLAQAQVLAAEVVQLFTPYCQRIAIAGSIRRRSCYVGDIEIVAIPKPGAENLFGDPCDETPHALSALIDAEIRAGRLAPRFDRTGRKCVGPRMAWLVFKGFALDVFCCTPEQWGVTMLVRTGPADYSEAFVTQTDKGGRFLKEGQSVKGWRLLQNGEPIDTPTEESVFTACGVPYCQPEDREWSK